MSDARRSENCFCLSSDSADCSRRPLILRRKKVAEKEKGAEGSRVKANTSLSFFFLLFFSRSQTVSRARVYAPINTRV